MKVRRLASLLVLLLALLMAGTAGAQEIQLSGPLLAAPAYGTSLREERLETSLLAVAVQDPARARVDALAGLRFEYHPYSGPRGLRDWLGFSVTGAHSLGGRAPGMLDSYGGPEVTFVPAKASLLGWSAHLLARGGVMYARVRDSEARLIRGVVSPQMTFATALTGRRFTLTLEYGSLLIGGTSLRPIAMLGVGIFVPGEPIRYCKDD